MRELRNSSLADLTSFGLGGPAARIVEVESEEEIALISSQLSNDTPMFVLGAGSNVVVDDAGWPGVILRPALRGIHIMEHGSRILVRIGAGEVWDDLVATCAEKGWVGVGCLSAIPGWVGAAPIQNIGAYGHEVASVVKELRAFDRHTESFVTFSNHACCFEYRSSTFRNTNRHIITSLTLSLEKSGGERIVYPELAKALGVNSGERVPAQRVRDTVIELRRNKGMVLDPTDPESRSAGSYFVNPIVDDKGLQTLQQRALQRGIVKNIEAIPCYQTAPNRWKLPAAWLIEQAGFSKGTTEAGVGISRKHALAFVNRGGTTSALLAFERKVRDQVLGCFSVELSREPILVRARSKNGW